MGFLDGLEQMASSAMEQSGNPQAKVAGGLMQALEEHPGGLQGVMDHLNDNGVDASAVAASGAPSPEAASALQGSGLLDAVAQKAGVSPQVAQEALAVVLPIVMSHFTQGGTGAPPSGGFAGMAGGLLSRFL
jgi:uncharacterized protein YidB (DUF937 family)